MNRRSLLSALSTIALTLVAPLAALAGSRRRDPRALGRDGKWYPARFVAWNEEVDSCCFSWSSGPPRAGEMLVSNPGANISPCSWNASASPIPTEPGGPWKQIADLRGLLAEAREHLKTCDRVPHNQAAYVHESLIARIDSALK